MSDTVFSKIIAGEVPSHKIYEDNKVLAFLDINPNNPGHTLVIPKREAEYVWDMTDDDYRYLMLIAKKLALHLRQKLPYQYVGMQIVGLDVAYAHVHLIPFNATNQLYNKRTGTIDHNELAAMAKNLFISKLV